MTIKQVISLMNINNIPFIPLASIARTKGDLSIYATKQGVCYWSEESIWSIEIDENSKNMLYPIKKELIQYSPELHDNSRELSKYVAVFEILHAINKYKNSNNGISFDTIKNYVDVLNKEILNTLDFQQIPQMELLKKIITKDKLFNQMVFNVSEIQSAKKNPFSGYHINKKEYCFGNVIYHEHLDCVHITIYDDCFELCCDIESRGSYEHAFDLRKHLTLEQKIISAFDYWQNYYQN